MRHGWDGEVGRYFLAYRPGASEPSDRAAVHTTDYDNLDLAWLGVAIHPEQRRRGYGNAGLRRRFDVCRLDGADQGRLGRLGPRAHRAASPRRCGCRAEVRSPSTAVSTCASSSRAWPTGCTPRRSRTPATTSSSASTAPTPEELLRGLAEATAAINDAPLDDLEIEDEVFTADRVRAYERAQLDSGFRFYRIIARHRATGEIAGLTVVTVDSRDAVPRLPARHLGRARAPGHRLGLLLKADMMRWLADAEPQLETAGHVEHGVQRRT